MAHSSHAAVNPLERGLTNRNVSIIHSEFMTQYQSSPLEAIHISSGARMVPFAGWNMPIQYESIIKEHIAVRESVGIFDISHMGQFFVDGPDACAGLDQLLTNHCAALQIGEGQYTIMLNQQGGVIDDLIVYRIGQEAFFLVVNAAKIDEDYAWLSSHLPQGATLRNESTKWAGMAIQGPKSAEAFARAYPGHLLPPRNGIITTDEGTILCGTGYTGETGFEFFCKATEAEQHWRNFTAAGATPCGLGARDTLRLEMCFPLNGNDLSPERTPVEAGLGFFCNMDKGEFMGKKTLEEQKLNGPEIKLAAIQYTEKGAPPRAHYSVLDADESVIGELTSGALSPTLNVGIAMAYLPVKFTRPGTPLWIDVRGRKCAAKVVKKPFYSTKPSSTITKN